jgi:hypothetical protein
VIFPIGSVFRSHQRRIRNHECLGELVVQPPTKLEVGDIDQRPFDLSLDGRRRERCSNAFSRLVKVLRFTVNRFGDFERIIVELEVHDSKKIKEQAKDELGDILLQYMYIRRITLDLPRLGNHLLHLHLRSEK